MNHFKYPLPMLLALILYLATNSISAADRQQYDIELLVFQHLVNSDYGEIGHNAQAGWLDETAVGQAGNASVSWLSAADYRLAPQQASLRSSASTGRLFIWPGGKRCRTGAALCRCELPVGKATAGLPMSTAV